MYKAVFLDLDGTLLDEEKNISEENKNAIKYAQSKGAYVCICSGRQFDIAKGFKEKAGADRYGDNHGQHGSGRGGSSCGIR